MRPQVETAVIERPGWIVVSGGIGEFLYEYCAKGIGGKKLEVAMEDEGAEILLKFLIAGNRDARLLQAGLDFLESSGPQARRRARGVGEIPRLGKPPQPV
jgi:hypothetical protein